MSGIPVTRASEEKEFQESQRSQGVKETMADLIYEWYTHDEQSS